jgi:hypothetical protein
MHNILILDTNISFFATEQRWEFDQVIEQEISGYCSNEFES